MGHVSDITATNLNVILPAFCTSSYNYNNNTLYTQYEVPVQVRPGSNPKVRSTHCLDLDLENWVRSNLSLARTLGPMGSVRTPDSLDVEGSTVSAGPAPKKRKGMVIAPMPALAPKKTKADKQASNGVDTSESMGPKGKFSPRKPSAR